MEVKERESAHSGGLLTVQEACEYLGIGNWRLYELMRGPEPAIPSIRLGKYRRIRKAALEAFIASLPNADQDRDAHRIGHHR